MSYKNQYVSKVETSNRCVFCDAYLLTVFRDRATGEEHLLCPGCRFYTSKTNINTNNNIRTKEVEHYYERNNRAWG